MPGTFPPLAANPNATDADYVRRVIVEGRTGPIDVLGSTYDSAMPAIALEAAQLDAVVAYVASIAVVQTPPTTISGQPPASASGDPANGEALFSGTTGLANGGAACFACHQAGSLSQGGAGLGPDLGGVADRLGGVPGLSAWLSAPPAPTMQPIYTDHPLTEPEIADLAAFLDSVDTTDTGGFDTALIGGLIGFGLLIAFMAFVLEGPRTTYAESLRRRS